MLDGAAAPDASPAIEIREEPRGGACRLLDAEVHAEEERLEACEQRIAFVQETPAQLHGPYGLIREARRGSFEHLGMRAEIGVEDRDEAACRPAECIAEGAGLVPFAGVAAYVRDIEPGKRQARECSLDDGRCVISGVVHDLNLELVLRIVQL